MLPKDFRAIKIQADMAKARRTLSIVLVISGLFMIGEFVGGTISHSLAILADAAHLLVDVVGFGLSLFFLWLGQGKPSPGLSYGYKRAEVLGTMLSMAMIWLIAGAICYVAVIRIQAIVNQDPDYQPVVGWLMFTLALLGVVCNLTIVVIIGSEGHGHTHGSHSHAGVHDDHSAPDPVLVRGHRLNGALEIVDTPAGERLRFLPGMSVPTNGVFKVEIDRPGQEVETLTFGDCKDQGLLSKEAPAEPHEFTARLVWTDAVHNESEVFAFSMSEPAGHHDAPEAVAVTGSALAGSVEIVDTLHGERLLFSPTIILPAGNTLQVVIERPSPQNEVLRLDPLADGTFMSTVPPAEPHEFSAHLVCIGPQAETLPFSLKEPRGHGHGHGTKHAKNGRNLNVTAAFVHALGHLAQDAGVVIAGALIWAYPAESNFLMQLADPIATFLFTLVGLVPTFSVIRVSVRLLLEAVPDGVDAPAIATQLAALPGVIDVHDLHIWGLTVDRVYASVHVLVERDDLVNDVVDRSHMVLQKNNVHHSTVQAEVERTIKHHEHSGIMCQKYGVPARSGVIVGSEMA